MKKFELTLFDNQDEINMDNYYNYEINDYNLITEFLKIKFETDAHDKIYKVSPFIYRELVGRFSPMYDATLKDEIERILCVDIERDKELSMFEVCVESILKDEENEPDQILIDYETLRSKLKIHYNLAHSILYISQNYFDLWATRGYLTCLMTDFRLEKIEACPTLKGLDFTIEAKED